ncbi:hypothetical protein QYS48_27420 [Marivirga arenosa]|uniref:Anti-sigma factor n=1 Tax=Marivirga arenosa TaxID=3059076 RepID=A0AA51N6E5_9BACT|nr:hypothetical protein [Marivirga sp. ABR2-2]WMN06992.1 hypothetical protein QYS48_27420 [Marivirga sp. ABR2-2]
MKKDKLEQFINHNRNQFEADFDLDKNWDQLEAKINKKKDRHPGWMVAASIAMLLVIGWLIYDRAILTDKINQLEQITYNNKPYAEIENYYQINITEKKAKINELSKQNNLSVKTDLAALNKKYKDLKSQVKNQGAHPQLVNAMIQNLQTQIEILEQKLNILQELQEYSKNEKQENNEISI